MPPRGGYEPVQYKVRCDGELMMLLWNQLPLIEGLGLRLVSLWDCGVGNKHQGPGFEAATIEIYTLCHIYHVVLRLAAEKRMDQADLSA